MEFVKEDSLLEYLLFSIHRVLFHTVCFLEFISEETSHSQMEVRPATEYV